MIEGRTALRLGIGLAVFGALSGGAGLGLAALVTSKQCGGEGDCAEWVQAIGSLVALLVAIAVPVLLQAQANRDARRRDDARIRSAALRLLPMLRRLHDRAGAISRWDGRRDEGRPVFIDPVAPAAGPQPLEALMAIPAEGWDEALHQSAELGGVGETVHLALRLIQETVERVDRAVTTAPYVAGDAVVLQSLRGHVRDAELALDRAIRALEALFPRSEDDASALLSGMDRRRQKRQPGDA